MTKADSIFYDLFVRDTNPWHFFLMLIPPFCLLLPLAILFALTMLLYDGVRWVCGGVRGWKGERGVKEKRWRLRITPWVPYKPRLYYDVTEITIRLFGFYILGLSFCGYFVAFFLLGFGLSFNFWREKCGKDLQP